MFKKISVLVDNDSWILPYANRLVQELSADGYDCLLCRDPEMVPDGDVCFFLGCTKLVKNHILLRNTYNMVVHESDLPRGKGFAPVTWQILAGKNEIPVCLVEASAEADSGDIWIRDVMQLDGTELNPAWRQMQGNTSVELAKKFIKEFRYLKPFKQEGNETFYPRRTQKDSILDPGKSLEEQFDLLRTVDNENYPAFFYLRGRKYKIKIYQDE